jgi:hypothetical protein
MKVKNAETGEYTWVDTSSAQTRKNYNNWFMNIDKKLKELFSRDGIDAINISTHEDYIKPLVQLFKKREARF